MAVEQPEYPTTWSRYTARELAVRIGVIALSALTVAVSWWWLSMDLQYISTAHVEMFDLFQRMYPPDVAYSTVIVDPLIETIHIAVVGTIIAVAMAAPVAFMAAENTTPNVLTYWLGKLIVTISRSVHAIVWALIFVVMFGPGAFAGMVAIAIRSVGFIGKLLGEEIEEIDFAQVEAIKATGASGIQTMLYSILPQIKPAIVGVSIYRWDINVRTATVLGFVGAGGIGVQLFEQVERFNWDAVLTVLIAILFIVLFSESVSAYARRKVR